MKWLILFPILFGLCFAQGCTSSQIERADSTDILPASMGGLGGYIGYAASDGASTGERIGVAGGAAVAGYSLGELIRNQIGKARKEAFAEGYKTGERVAVKETSLLADRISQTEEGAGQPRMTLYAFPGDESSQDGVKLMRHDVVMPVLE